MLRGVNKPIPVDTLFHFTSDRWYSAVEIHIQQHRRRGRKQRATEKKWFWRGLPSHFGICSADAYPHITYASTTIIIAQN